MRDLVIVESVTKAKKIQSFLGNQYLVKASVGHVCDLPQKELGVDLKTFAAQWEVPEKSRKTIASLKKAVKESANVYLATDPDREGEAIAWHLQRILKLKDPKRITFNEITPAAIAKAIATPRTIDDKAVNAQTARRLLDRLVGYQLSPVLSRAAQAKLSAGRVQSVALKLCVMRELDIRHFMSKPYFELYAAINGMDFKFDHQPFLTDKHVFDRAFLENIQSQCQKLQVTGFTEEEAIIMPRPPFITSTLQQSASTSLGLPPEETMKTAQKLFEEGLITYHRTDNPNFSDEGFQILTAMLQTEQGMDARPTAIKRQSAALAQEAHEAIRPTGIHDNELTPSQQQLLSISEPRNLYRLIRERSLCAVAPDGLDMKTRIVLEGEAIELPAHSLPVAPQWIWQGRVVKVAGWRSLAVLEASSEEENVFNGVLKAGDTLNPEFSIQEKKTKAPERFTEASLIKALEKLGIGRPSTYATILSNIKSRGYIKLSQRKIHAQPIGMDLVASLEPMTFMNYDFTRKVEAHLDQVAKGANHIAMLKTINEVLMSEMKTLKPVFSKDNRITDKCPQCGEMLTFRKAKKTGKPYWIHLLPTDICQSFINDADGKPAQVKPGKAETVQVEA